MSMIVGVTLLMQNLLRDTSTSLRGISRTDPFGSSYMQFFIGAKACIAAMAGIEGRDQKPQRSETKGPTLQRLVGHGMEKIRQNRKLYMIKESLWCLGSNFQESSDVKWCQSHKGTHLGKKWENAWDIVGMRQSIGCVVGPKS